MMLTRERIENLLRAIISENLEISNDFSNDATFNELGAQSITMMKVQTDISKQFSVRVKFVAMYENNTVNKLTNYIQERLK